MPKPINIATWLALLPISVLTVYAHMQPTQERFAEHGMFRVGQLAAQQDVYLEFYDIERIFSTSVNEHNDLEIESATLDKLKLANGLISKAIEARAANVEQPGETWLYLRTLVKKSFPVPANEKLLRLMENYHEYEKQIYASNTSIERARSKMSDSLEADLEARLELQRRLFSPDEVVALFTSENSNLIYLIERQRARQNSEIK